MVRGDREAAVGADDGSEVAGEGELGRGLGRALVVIGRRRRGQRAARDGVLRQVDGGHGDEPAIVHDRQRAREQVTPRSTWACAV
jgi:hypothetical protein